MAGTDSLIRSDLVSSGLPEPMVDRLAAALMDGHSVLVTGAASPSPLLAAAARHPRLAQARVLRVGPPLDLIAMLRQVTDDDGPADATLEQGFDALTVPSAGCDRIALLVEDAHLLPHATLRYIEFALRAGPHLQVVLAGQPGIMDMLALEGFAGLRNRVPLHLELPDPGPERAGLPAADLTPGPGPAAAYRMTPPRLLACAAAAASLAVAGIISLGGPNPSTVAASAGPGVAPLPAAIDLPSEPVSIQAATMPLDLPAPEPEISAAAAQPGPGAEPLPAPAGDAAPALAADVPVAPRTVATNAPDLPAAAAPESTPAASDLPLGPLGEAGSILAADMPVAPGTAAADAPALPPAPASEAASEVAEAAPVATPLPAASEPPDAPVVPSLAEIPDPGPLPVPEAGEPLTGAPAAGPDLAPGKTTLLPPAAHLTVPLPAARQVRAAAPPPAVPRAPARSAAFQTERVADRPSAPGQDGQRCRGIILRLQLGESPTDGDRTFLRNGCR